MGGSGYKYLFGELVTSVHPFPVLWLYMQKDHDLVIRILNTGSEQALLTLVRKHERSAFNLSFRIIGNREEAEEVAQDAFMKSFKELRNLKDPSKYRPWLMRIVYTMTIDRTRLKKQVVSEVEITEIADVRLNDPGPLELIRVKERRNWVEEMLQELNDIDRGIITLYYLENFSVNEVSQMVDLSASNVKIRLMRARAVLCDKLNKRLRSEKKNLY